MTSPAPNTFTPGANVAVARSLTSDERTVVTAGQPVSTIFEDRSAAFGAAYDGSLGADRGALLIGKIDTGYFVQEAMVTSDGVQQPWHFEQLHNRPIIRGRADARLLGVIDGQAFIPAGR